MKTPVVFASALALCAGIFLGSAARATITSAERDDAPTLQEVQAPVPVRIVADYRRQGYSGVLDLGTYTNIDDDKMLAATNARLDGSATAKDVPGRNCSAIMKPLMVSGARAVVMARNMDLPNSYYPAYLFRVDQPGKYKSLNIGYLHFNMETFDQIAATGTMDGRMHARLPFQVTDIINEKGLIIETNMRDTCLELNATGTNPGKKRICSAVLQRYLGDHCATIADVLKTLDELDVYTANSKEYNWHQALGIVDATGRFGVLEFVKNRPVWHEGQPGQTNFWIDETARETAREDQGLGRWAVLMQNYDGIRTQKDMLKAIRKVWYSQLFMKEARFSTFDILTEMTDTLVQDEIDTVLGWRKKYGIRIDDGELAAVQAIADEQKKNGIQWTHPYVTAPRNMLKVYRVADFITHAMQQLPEKGLKLSGKHEVSSLCLLANPREKRFHVQFFEQPQIFRFGFDGLKPEK